MLRRRRWKLPESDRPAGEAQRAVREAVRGLDAALRRQPDVDETTDRLARINRENRLAPRIAAALGAHRG